MSLDSVWNSGSSGAPTPLPKRVTPAPVFGATRPSTSGGGLANSYKQAPPERLDVNSIFSGATAQPPDQPVPLQALEILGRAPGFVYERPIAALDILAQRAGLGSPVKGIEETVGGIPILGPLVGGLSDVFANIGNFFPAIQNSGDISILAKIPTETSDNVLLRSLDLGRAWSATKTVGDFRREMRARGFTDADIAAVRSGAQSSFDYGNRATDDDPMADVVFRLGMDPLNLLLGTGLITKAARGVGLLAKASRAGAVLSHPLPLPEAIAAVARGSAREATWAGVAGYMGSTYRKAAIGLTAGQLAVQTVGPTLANTFEDTPASGFLEGLNEVNKAVMDNRPLSDNMVFTIWSAFNFPVVKPVKQLTGQVGRATYARIGSSVRPMIVEALTDRMPRSTPYATRLAHVQEKLGGPQGLEQFAYHMMGSMVARKIPERLKEGMTGFDSLVESVAAIKTYNSVVVDMLATAFKRNTIHGRDVVAAMKDWHAFRRDPAGGGAAVNAIAFPWNGELAMETWSTYSVAASRLSQISDDTLIALVGNLDDPLPIIGLSGSISTHDLSAMQAMVRVASEEGYVPAAVLERVLNRAPQLMKLDTTGFWEKQLLPGAPAVKLDSVIGKLGSLKKNASTLREITHEFAAAEGPVSHGLPNAKPDIFESQGAMVSASRYQASLEGWGIKRTISDAAAERARPEIQAMEHNIGDVLEKSGVDVTKVVQTIGTYEREREPGFRIFLNSGSLVRDRMVAALVGQTGEQRAVLLTMSARQAAARGVEINGVTLHWTLPTTETRLLNRVAEVMDAQFDGWTLVDGKIDVALHQDWMPAGYGLKARLEAVDDGLRGIFPGDAVGDRGIIHTTHRAYVEMIDGENYGNAIAAAGSDPRVAAFNGLKARLTDRGPASGVDRGGGRAGGLLRQRAGAVGGGDGGNLPIDPSKSLYDQVGHGTVADATSLPGALPGTSRPIEKGYLYHTTDAAQEVAGDALRPQGPGYRGEQIEWPWTAPGDNPQSRRSYWARDITRTEPYRAGTDSAILRVKEGAAPGRVRNEPAGGDVYLTRQVLAKDIEVLGGDGQWHPLRGFYDKQAIPPELQPALDVVGPAYTLDPGIAKSRAGIIDDIADDYAGSRDLFDREVAAWREGTPPASPLTQALRADQDAIQVLKVHPDATPEFIKDEILYMAGRDAAVEAILPPITRFESGGIEHASQAFRDALSPVERYLHALGPQYTIKPAPKMAWLYKPDAAGPMMAALRDREGLAAWALQDSPLAPVARFMGWLTAPVKGNVLAVAAKQALYAELVPMGAKPKQIDAWVATMVDKASNVTVGRHQAEFFRGPGSLPAQAINSLAGDAFRQNRKFLATAGGGFHFEKVFDRANNRFIRTIETKRLTGESGRLQRAADNVYRMWQDTPALGSSGRLMGKTYYTIFRFLMDPRWHAMNLVESDILAMMRYGRKAAGKPGSEMGPAAATHQAGGVAVNVEQSGMFYSRNMGAHVSRSFDITRPDTVLDTLRGMDDAGLTAIRRLFPEAKTDADLAVELDNMLYSFDTKGVEATITENLAQFGDQRALAQPGAAAMVNRIYQANDQAFRDIVRVFEGNAERSTLERLLNSYWLYWPISYQLKAGRWMLDTLTNKAFGRTTNLAGAAAYSEMVKLHRDRVETDPEYAAIFSENPTFWRIAQMMLPITPGDLGVSLSRPVRYAGSWVRDVTGGDESPLGFWGQYKAAKGPVEAADAILDLGLPYSLDMAGRVSVEYAKPDYPIQ